jgi:hypothetical protein
LLSIKLLLEIDRPRDNEELFTVLLNFRTLVDSDDVLKGQSVYAEQFSQSVDRLGITETFNVHPCHW